MAAKNIVKEFIYDKVILKNTFHLLRVAKEIQLRSNGSDLYK